MNLDTAVNAKLIKSADESLNSLLTAFKSALLLEIRPSMLELIVSCTTTV